MSNYTQLTPEEQLQLAQSFNDVANEFVAWLNNDRERSAKKLGQSFTEGQANSYIAEQAIRKIWGYGTRDSNGFLNALKVGGQAHTQRLIDASSPRHNDEIISACRDSVLKELFVHAYSQRVFTTQIDQHPKLGYVMKSPLG
jgi:hypothetical protein